MLSPRNLCVVRATSLEVRINLPLASLLAAENVILHPYSHQHSFRANSKVCETGTDRAAVSLLCDINSHISSGSILKLKFGGY